MYRLACVSVSILVIKHVKNPIWCRIVVDVADVAYFCVELYFDAQFLLVVMQVFQ